MDLTNWDTVFGIAQKIFTIIGIIAGGVWTYFHYFHGRTYRPRLETNVSGKILKHDEVSLLVATIKIKNVGLSKIDIKQKGSGMRIIGLEKKSNVQEIEKNEGVRLKTIPVFENHAWIEPGETVEDIHTLTLPNQAYIGLMLDVRLVTNKIAWRFSSVIDFPKTPTNNKHKQED